MSSDAKKLEQALDACQRALVTLAYCSEQDWKNERISAKAHRTRLSLIERSLGIEVPGADRP